ncbi:MAG: PilZ domain-containing protein [Myxococcota bacterium]|nr:PilZ domain-containing protein [Myxococcota bacterium]
MTAHALNDPQRITLHLEAMAESTRGAVLTIGRRQVFGELGYPHPDSGETTFLVHPALHGLLDPPAQGTTVQLEYQTQHTRYAFFTTVQGAHTPMLWRLARPQAISRRETRKHRRLELSALFRTHAGQFQEVVDISEGGFGLIVQGAPPRVGTQLQGWLDVEGLPPTAILATVRHERKADQHCIVGCSIDHIHPNDLAALRQLLSGLGG